METRSRSLAKAISWRIFATITTMLLVFAFTGNLVISESVGLAELVSKIVIYYVHERPYGMPYVSAGFRKQNKGSMNLSKNILR